MLDTFENDMILSAVQQLTTEVQRVEGKVNKVPAIPAPAVADAGKVLGVDEDGDYALVEGGGGGKGGLNLHLETVGTEATYKIANLPDDLLTFEAAHNFVDNFRNEIISDEITAPMPGANLELLVYHPWRLCAVITASVLATVQQTAITSYCYYDNDEKHYLTADDANRPLLGIISIEDDAVLANVRAFDAITGNEVMIDQE